MKSSSDQPAVIIPALQFKLRSILHDVNFEGAVVFPDRLHEITGIAKMGRYSFSNIELSNKEELKWSMIQ